MRTLLAIVVLASWLQAQETSGWILVRSSQKSLQNVSWEKLAKSYLRRD